MGLDRRTFLRGTAGAGALLIGGAVPAWGVPRGRLLNTLDSTRSTASRASRLFPDDGRFVCHSDLHNHTLLSDGAGDADAAFAMMRDAGLDVAALTDHAVAGKFHGDVTCNKVWDPQSEAGTGTCSPWVGINETSWRRMAELADESYAPGEFVAMRGFEWTTGSMGHVNVWFSETWIDAAATGGLTELRDVGVLVDTVADRSGFGDGLPPELHAIVDSLPSTASIDGFYDWLAADPSSPLLGGGADALAGFNHPNEYGNFDSFRFVGKVADRFVSCEAHNGPAVDGAVAYDYWFRGVEEGQPWPINALLNAGWHVGLLGVSDNHTDTFGRLDAARGGLWVRELSREGVREALLTRRLFSTTRPGLRLDASINGVPMGSQVTHQRGPVHVELDLDLGPDGYGERLVVEVARPGSDEPALAEAVEVRLPSPDEPVIAFDLDLDVEDGEWLVLRICDPSAPLDPYATGSTWTRHGGAIAYASPFWFAPEPAAVADQQRRPEHAGDRGGAGAAPPASASDGRSDGSSGRRLPATGSGAGTGAVGAIATAALIHQLGRSSPGPGHDHHHEG